MRKLVILIALILCLPTSSGNIDKKLPDLERTVLTGCEVKQVLDARTKESVWQLIVWAHYSSLAPEKKDWKLWYSTRTKRMKALKDCDLWLKQVAKKVKASRFLK